MMHQAAVKLTRKTAAGYVIPLGPIAIVAAVTDVGLVGCGAFDVGALERFSYPAAIVRPASGPSIATIDDLLAGFVKAANPSAERRGIALGMTGRDALELL